MSRVLSFAVAMFAIGLNASAQTVPQNLYFKFNEGAGAVTANQGFPGVGNPFPSLGAAAGFGPGKFGTALTGAGTTGGANYVDTGYAMNLNGQSWTIEFWWQTATTSSTLQYLCGSNTSTSAFRIFASGVAANFIVISATGLTGVSMAATPAPGVWNHYAWAYDASVTPNTLTAYKNGAFVGSSNQTGVPVLNTGNFIVGGQSTQGGLNGFLDEFRLWTTARTAAEILASYNGELFNENILSATTTGGGVGDLTLSLTNITSTAVEGFTFISGSTPSPVGLGPVFGITPDALTWPILTWPLGVGDPLHFVVGVPGVYPASPLAVPPGALSAFAGLSFDMVSAVFAPGFALVGRSNVQRLNW